MGIIFRSLLVPKLSKTLLTMSRVSNRPSRSRGGVQNAVLIGQSPPILEVLSLNHIMPGEGSASLFVTQRSYTYIHLMRWMEKVAVEGSPTGGCGYYRTKWLTYGWV